MTGHRSLPMSSRDSSKLFETLPRSNLELKQLSTSRLQRSPPSQEMAKPRGAGSWVEMTGKGSVAGDAI